MMLENDEHYMEIAILEAKKGEGRTSPNPCVGAVIVKNGRIISKGYHKKSGTPHAEVNAIRNAEEPLAGSTIYVTLEPCNHTGKTPPCTEMILKNGISRVVVGMTDPNPLVNGSGVAFLMENGLEVITGVLVDECEEIIRPFIKYITMGIPWMIMKGGISLDGKINYIKGKSGWITGKESVLEVHKIRDKVDAILVGGETVRIDNPALTTRNHGVKGKDPIRVIVDTRLHLPLSSNVFHIESEAPAWVFCSTAASVEKISALRKLGVEVVAVEENSDGVDLEQVLKALGKAGVCSVLVEGGSRLHGSFLKEGLFDSACLFYAPLFAGDNGVPLVTGYSSKDSSSAARLVDVSYKRLGDDMMVSGRFEYAQAEQVDGH